MNAPLAATTENEFNYSRLVHRTDSVYPPYYAPTACPRPPRPRRGIPRDVLACVLGIWKQFSLPELAIAAMGGVLTGLLTHLTKAGLTIHTVDEDDLIRLRHDQPHRAPQAHPRRGTTASQRHQRRLPRPGRRPGHRARITPGTAEPQRAGQGRTRLRPKRNQRRSAPHPARHPNAPEPAPPAPRGRKRRHLQQRRHRSRSPPGALARLHPRPADIGRPNQPQRSSRHEHRLTHHRHRPVGTRRHQRLEGRAVHQPPRPRRRLHALHRNQALTSNSAAVSADQQIKKALKLAGLAETKGLTAGSLRLWSILKDATDLASAATAARHGGITIVTLHTKVQNLLDLADA